MDSSSSSQHFSDGQPPATGAASAVKSAPRVSIASVSLPTPARNSPLRDIWHLLSRNPKVMAGFIIMLFFVLVAIFGPFFIHTDPNALSNDALLPPSASHWLGTTQTGQDIFSQLVVGTRTTIFWGFLTGILATIISVVIGLTSGYFGGFIDDALSLFINVFLVIPGFPLAIVLAAFVTFKGPAVMAIVITLTSWAWGARVLRAQTLSMRRRDFVEAARASGESTTRVIFFEILPNMIGIVAAGFIGTVVYVILADIALEFLGLGDPNVVSWGSMFFWAQNNDAILLGAWWWFLPTGLCVALVGTALSFINYGIDEIANPRLRREPKVKSTQKKKEAVA